MAQREQPPSHSELSARDHFAVAALRALLTSEIRGFNPPSLSDPESYHLFAVEAYRLADAMLRVRDMGSLPTK